MRILITATLSLFLMAQASPDKNYPPGPLNDWYRSLKSPKTGGSCCDISDCRPVEYRMAGDQYEVLIQGKWHKVPNDVVIHNKDNPTGSAVGCWSNHITYPDGSVHWYCFVPGFGV